MTRWRTVCPWCEYEIAYGDEHGPQADGSVSCYVHLTVTTPNLPVDRDELLRMRAYLEEQLHTLLHRSTFPLLRLGPEWFQTPSDEEIARMEGEGGPPC